MSNERPKIVVLLSGRGSNFNAILDSINNGQLSVDICLVGSNNPDAPGLKYAQDNSIPVSAKKVSDFSSKDDYEAWLISEIQNVNPDLIVLAGYMRVLGPSFITTFPNKIINIHPSLLPAFKGLDAQQQALDYGVKFAGCTVHYVDHDVDSGEIIDQCVVPVYDDDSRDSLAARILIQEHQLYSLCVQKVLEKQQDS